MTLHDELSAPEDRPLVATILGDAGMGKTRLAATFPNPVFIRSEDGMQSIPRDQRPAAFPILKSADALWEQMTRLIKEKHDFQTLVIDSVTKLDLMFVEDIMAKDKASGGTAKSINQALGGYGAGREAVSAAHARLRRAAAVLNERRGMNVIFIAHADTETMRTPDHDDYTRYTLRMNAKSVAPYVDDVDLVGFIRLQQFVRGDEGERKRVQSTGKRELICHAVASGISKNRFGITKALTVIEGENPLLGLVPIAGVDVDDQEEPPSDEPAQADPPVSDDLSVDGDWTADEEVQFRG